MSKIMNVIAASSNYVDNTNGSSGIIFAIVALVICVITIVAMCKIFIKMGEPGWAAFVPYYNMWLLYKHTMGSGWKMFLTLIPVYGYIISIIQLWKTYKGFGKSGFFAFVGLFFSPICLLICAFDSSSFTDQ